MKLRAALKELLSAFVDVIRSLLRLGFVFLKLWGLIAYSVWMLVPEILRIVILVMMILLSLRFADGLYTEKPVYVVIPNCSLPVGVNDSEIGPGWPLIYRWCELIMFASVKYGHDPNLLAAIVFVESRGNPLAYSRSGAVGLMQVMPRDGLAASFQCPNGPCFANRPTIVELQDPAFNVETGSRILRDNYIRTGSYRDALKAYGPANAGYTYADLVLGVEQRIVGSGWWPEN